MHNTFDTNITRLPNNFGNFDLSFNIELPSVLTESETAEMNATVFELRSLCNQERTFGDGSDFKRFEMDELADSILRQLDKMKSPRELFTYSKASLNRLKNAKEAYDLSKNDFIRESSNCINQCRNLERKISNTSFAWSPLTPTPMPKLPSMQELMGNRTNPSPMGNKEFSFTARAKALRGGNTSSLSDINYSYRTFDVAQKSSSGSGKTFAELYKEVGNAPLRTQEYNARLNDFCDAAHALGTSVAELQNKTLHNQGPIDRLNSAANLAAENFSNLLASKNIAKERYKPVIDAFLQNPGSLSHAFNEVQGDKFAWNPVKERPMSYINDNSFTGRGKPEALGVKEYCEFLRSIEIQGKSAGICRSDINKLQYSFEQGFKKEYKGTPSPAAIAFFDLYHSVSIEKAHEIVAKNIDPVLREYLNPEPGQTILGAYTQKRRIRGDFARTDNKEASQKKPSSENQTDINQPVIPHQSTSFDIMVTRAYLMSSRKKEDRGDSETEKAITEKNIQVVSRPPTPAEVIVLNAHMMALQKKEERAAAKSDKAITQKYLQMIGRDLSTGNLVEIPDVIVSEAYMKTYRNENDRASAKNSHPKKPQSTPQELMKYNPFWAHQREKVLGNAALAEMIAPVLKPVGSFIGWVADEITKDVRKNTRELVHYECNKHETARAQCDAVKNLIKVSGAFLSNLGKEVVDSIPHTDFITMKRPKTNNSKTNKPQHALAHALNKHYLIPLEQGIKYEENSAKIVKAVPHIVGAIAFARLGIHTLTAPTVGTTVASTGPTLGTTLIKFLQEDAGAIKLPFKDVFLNVKSLIPKKWISTNKEKIADTTYDALGIPGTVDNYSKGVKKVLKSLDTFSNSYERTQSIMSFCERVKSEKELVAELAEQIPFAALAKGFPKQQNSFVNTCKILPFEKTNLGASQQGSLKGHLLYKYMKKDILFYLRNDKHNLPERFQNITKGMNLISPKNINSEEKIQALANIAIEFANKKGAEKIFFVWNPAHIPFASTIESSIHKIEKIGKFSQGLHSPPLPLIEVKSALQINNHASRALELTEPFPKIVQTMKVNKKFSDEHLFESMVSKMDNNSTIVYLGYIEAPKNLCSFSKGFLGDVLNNFKKIAIHQGSKELFVEFAVWNPKFLKFMQKTYPYINSANANHLGQTTSLVTNLGKPYTVPIHRFKIPLTNPSGSVLDDWRLRKATERLIIQPD